MGKTSLAIFLGVCLGVVATVLVQRAHEHRQAPDPDTLADRLSEKLESLESGETRRKR